MARKRLTDKQYKQRVKALRPFVEGNIVNLSRKLTPADKRKITRLDNAIKPDSLPARRYLEILPYLSVRYKFPPSSHTRKKIKSHYDELQKLGNRKHVVYRSKDPQKLKAAQEVGGHSPALARELKVAVIPFDGAGKGRVRVSKSGKVTVSSKFTKQTFIEFSDRAALELDTIDYINSLVAEYDDDDVFTVRTALYTVPGSRSKELIAEFVARLVDQYSSIDDWLAGLIVNNFQAQKSVEELKADMARIKGGDKRKKTKPKKVKKLNL